MKDKLKKIALVTNTERDNGSQVTSRYEAFLSGFDCSCVRVPFGAPLGNGVSLAVVFGGDGTIMREAHIAAPKGIPILGVNLGKVGYLAELEPDEEKLMAAYFSGDYSVEERMMLTVTDPSGTEHTALNDAVVSMGESARILTLELSCDGEEVGEYYGNGLIISTPTGSTAYSLSAGGPIISPGLSCMAVTPVCTHSLSARPMIFDDGSTLSVVNASRPGNGAVLNVDGRDIIAVPAGGTVSIRKSVLRTKLIRIKHEGFYTVLGRKMKK